MANPTPTKWRLRGVVVVHADELDVNTPQTPGMNRAAAITVARAGAEKLWAGTVVIHAVSSIDPANSRLQRTALRAAAEPPGR